MPIDLIFCLFHSPHFLLPHLIGFLFPASFSMSFLFPPLSPLFSSLHLLFFSLAPRPPLDTPDKHFSFVNVNLCHKAFSASPWKPWNVQIILRNVHVSMSPPNPGWSAALSPIFFASSPWCTSSQFMRNTSKLALYNAEITSPPHCHRIWRSHRLIQKSGNICQNNHHAIHKTCCAYSS